MQRLVDAGTDVRTHARDAAAEAEHQALLAQQSLRNLMGMLIVAVVLIVLFAAMLFSRALTKPLLVVVDNLKEISEGEADLTRTLMVNSKDEVGDLAENFNNFVARLREMVQRLQSAGKDITVATEKIRHTSQDVSNGTVNQAGDTGESSSDDGSCSCRVGASHRNTGPSAVVWLVASALLLSRRRR